MKTKNFIILLEQEKDGGFSVSVPSLPGCFSQGNTFEEALTNIKAAIKLYLKDAKSEFLNKSRAEFAIPIEIGV